MTQTVTIPVPNPPYLIPSDFFLFLWMKKVLEGKRFANVEEVKQKMAEALNGIKIYQLKNCLEQWKKRLDRHIVSDGQSFESG